MIFASSAVEGEIELCALFASSFVSDTFSPPIGIPICSNSLSTSHPPGYNRDGEDHQDVAAQAPGVHGMSSLTKMLSLSFLSSLSPSEFVTRLLPKPLFD